MKKIKNVMGLLLVGVFFVVITARVSGLTKSEEHYVCMEDAWKVTINDTVYENVTLETFRFPMLHKQDVVRLEHTLPEKLTENPALSVCNIRSTITVLLAGEEIYSYGNELYEEGKLLGYAKQFINLPEQSAGQKIEIIYQISENNAFHSIEAPKVYNALYAYVDFIRENMITLIVDLFLIVFGIAVAGTAAAFAIKHKAMLRLVWIALFSLCIGCWSFASYELTILFTDDLQLRPFMEYFALYTAPIFILLYFKDQILSGAGKLLHRLYECLKWMLIAFVVVASVLQIFDICHFPTLLLPSHVLEILLIVLIVSSMIRNIRRKKMDDPSVIVGILIMGTFVSFDLVNYNLIKYTTLFTDRSFSGYTSIGALIFVISLIIDFCNQMSQNLYDSAKNDMLKKMAYTDVLTKLSNRRRCEEVFEKIDETGLDYSIIEYDLNSLKQTNDNYGHDEGDQMLIVFSEILQEVFGKYGCVCRTGGDEFVVILTGKEAKEVYKLIKRADSLIEKKNKLGASHTISVAYGVSTFKEDNLPSVRRAYKLADERMYENKNAMKHRI